jgi:signal transduction histidine kinase
VRIDKPGEGDRLPARGEFRRVLQIMMNLLVNAIRYSPEGGMIWIRPERDGDTASITVADLGKGHRAEDQARIFDKFERVDPNEPAAPALASTSPAASPAPWAATWSSTAPRARAPASP